MKQPNLAKWERKSELEGLLVFGQVLEEMLFNYTVDSYKAPALNPASNAMELRYLARGLQESKITSATIVPVIDELESKLKNDPIVKPKYHSVFALHVDRMKRSKNNARELMSLADSLLIELEGFYWKSLKEQIELAVRDPKGKAEIIALASAFITEAELMGFSRNYVYYKANQFFFVNDSAPKHIEKAEQIADFLEQFPGEPSQWQVVFRGSSAFESLRDAAKQFSHQNAQLEIVDTVPDGVPAASKGDVLLGKQRELPLFINVRLDRSENVLEPVSARETAKRAVETFSDLYSFMDHKEPIDISSDALVINSDRSDATVLKPNPNPMLCGLRRLAEEEQSRKMDAFIDIFNGTQFDGESTRLFVKALDYHRAALEAETPENQLLDLWALLEGFLPAPAEDATRISYYVENLIPALTLTYPEKIFLYITESLYHSRDEVRGVVERIPQGKNFFEKTVAVVVCEDLSKELDSMFGKLNDHPLLRYRIYQACEWFKSRRHTKKTVWDHRERVSWHIRRIYTTRNYIMHNAVSFRYLRTLVENLHSYVDTLIDNLALISMMSVNKISIAAGLKALAVHEQAYLKSLDGDEDRCTTANFEDIIFGESNPLSPYRLSLTLSRD